MAILFALLAAGSNALATIMQRIGVEQEAPGPTSVSSLLLRLVRRRVWIAGLALMTACFLLQALALSLGDLSTIQPIMVTEILFLVLILATWFHQWIGWKEWVGVGSTAVGLGAFLGLSSSHGGNGRPSAFDWLLLIVACAVAIGATWAAGHRGPRAWRAACYGCAAGISFALTAAFIKATTDQWSTGGFHVFEHFEAYGIALAGLLGLVISQNALAAGPIAASQSALLIVNPLSSIVMGIWLFDDRVQASGARGYFEAASLIVLFMGLFVLSHSPLVAADGYPERLSSARHHGGSIDVGEV